MGKRKDAVRYLIGGRVAHLCTVARDLSEGVRALVKHTDDSSPERDQALDRLPRGELEEALEDVEELIEAGLL